ncbi:solute carrier family 35 member G1-like isoform X2 [Tachypleus tridentatus]|uniref:solute carrier family 35 member G1-like isoform X2 n=1 Tax=Tachypleus tridentatus TaxID=6853 RepID=UPI003FD428BD
MKMSYKKKLGYIHIFLAAVAEGVFGLFVQLIEELEPEDVIGLNNVLRLLFLMPFVIYSKTPLLFDIKTMLLIALRSIFSAGSMSLLTYSYTLLPIGDAAAIYYCNPPLTMLLSMCFLRSKCQVLEILAGLSCFVGWKYSNGKEGTSDDEDKDSFVVTVKET